MKIRNGSTGTKLLPGVWEVPRASLSLCALHPLFPLPGLCSSALPASFSPQRSCPLVLYSPSVWNLPPMPVWLTLGSKGPQKGFKLRVIRLDLYFENSTLDSI